MATTRQATCKILEMVEESVLDKMAVIQACLSYMSEDDVKDMARINGFFDSFSYNPNTGELEEIEEE